MELRTLKAFVEVVRQGGFSEAAKVVFTTQSAVSKAVRQLEDELGLPLLNRLGHRVTLTDAGEVVYRRAIAILAGRDDLLAELSELRGLTRGTLRLGLPPIGNDALFAPVFAVFRNRYPGIEIRLVEQGAKRLEEMVLADEVDLGASLLPMADVFEWQVVRCEPMHVLLPSAHPLAGQQTVPLAALKDYPFLLFETGFALNGIILNACRAAGFAPDIAARSSQINFIVELVAAGLGIGFLPRLIAEQSRRSGIAHALVVEPDMEWNMAWIWRRGGYLSHAGRAWLDLAAEIAAKS
ncbi:MULTISPECIES: LysR family transcriptional regulator [unclassified Rhizobium]|jgi:DNA-binding transcriptional LysR family regulator|uniref:LysR family transcriptional regulator n=1 Tax=unclassified Rhizobium TaxID=2613769 RepID=UPI000DC37989|nr:MULTISPECIES: LysR family transcriptional regulator [unclassified Rhizobium]MBB3386346.1 DNA-binding transcriptional LysR family regulator [Rhizobium sp. BK098]MBB3567527.1 DNA-binding transcriptional LysR family regulator [Rhizobium sp. BK491]MBB3618129.1 DNA-binding transcriptional LysR family regulator [Rhizobium sp. BK609]MBB3683707.1 DNA-binding transcriptional LysR family regulator [Rhizobium sp. BK612]